MTSAEQSTRLLFVLGAPRSGTTMLEHMLSAHSRICGGPEPHLLTPLAHLGVWRRVDKAPYDHIVAALGQRAFVDSLPQKEKDYWRACRAYCDSLYGAYISGKEATLCMDKTPEYSTIWPFLFNVYPDAKYIVLTRHPGAIFTSFANSFFEGNYRAAVEHDPVIERYVPALASLIRQQAIEICHIRYDELVANPEQTIQTLCNYLEIPFEPQLIDYGQSVNRETPKTGLGDPIGVTRHKRPSSASLNKWAEAIANNELAENLLKQSIAKLSTEDLATIGYPMASFWQPLHEVDHSQAHSAAKTEGSFKHRLQRKLILQGRCLARQSTSTRSALQWLRMACDVMLREY